MSARSIAIAALAASLLAAAPAAFADPNPANNKNAVSRDLVCPNGQTFVATFAGLEGSDFNISINQSVFVYKYISIDGVITSRGVQGTRTNSDPLVSCSYTTPSLKFVVAVGFFTGQGV
jgi:hypothetical protein